MEEVQTGWQNNGPISMCVYVGVSLGGQSSNQAVIITLCTLSRL